MPEQPRLRTPTRMPSAGLSRCDSSSRTRSAAASVTFIAWNRAIAEPLQISSLPIPRLTPPRAVTKYRLLCGAFERGPQARSAQASHRPGEPVGGAVQFRLGREAAEADAQGRGRGGIVEPERAQHIGRLDLGRGAG